MSTIANLLENDPRGSGELKLRFKNGMKGFGRYLPENVNPIFPCALSRFTTHTPSIYWKRNTVDLAIAALENSSERTCQAINKNKRALDIAFANILRRSATSCLEETLDSNKSNELLMLSTDFHSEYLRFAQHIFSNLISLIWSICKKKSVEGKFDLNGATAFLKSEGKEIFHSYPIADGDFS
jgi:hypothetical protein